MVEGAQTEPVKVAVVGSFCRDIFLKVNRLPKVGETIGSEGIVRAWGGKGANTAVATARLGGSTSMLGQVGNDEDGQGYISYL